MILGEGNRRKAFRKCVSSLSDWFSIASQMEPHAIVDGIGTEFFEEANDVCGSFAILCSVRELHSEFGEKAPTLEHGETSGVGS